MMVIFDNPKAGTFTLLVNAKNYWRAGIIYSIQKLVTHCKPYHNVFGDTIYRIKPYFSV